jgi:UDP-glucose 4-epimerase
MKILITGGAGFIGSHLADAYLAAGYEVVIVDNLSTGLRANLPAAARFYEVDLIADDQLREIFYQEKPDIVSHQAAQVDVRHSVSDPRFDARTNIIGGVNLLELVRETAVKYVIFASTGGAIYGDPDYSPMDESHPLRPISPYGIAKLTIEKYLDYYHRVYGLPYTALRYGNVYGPRQNPKGEAGVVGIFCEQMLRGEPPLINGNGQQTRDYVYISDVIAANLLVTAQRESLPHAIFNVGTGIETSVCQIFTYLQTILNTAFVALHAPSKKGEQQRSILDCQQIQQQLGWQPTIDLATGLHQTVDFFQSKIEANHADNFEHPQPLLVD